MIIEFFGKNFGCFRDEFRLSMLATDIDPDSDRGIVEVEIEGEDEPLRLLRSAAIYGPNASGKSTVIRAAFALGYLVRASAGFTSDEQIPPYEPFLLDRESRSKPVELGIRAVLNRRVYDYSISFSLSEFIRECLVEITPNENKTLFERNGQTVKGIWTADERFHLLTEADSFRPNVLILSIADTLIPTLARGIAVGIRRSLGFDDPTQFQSRRETPTYVANRASKDEVGFGESLRTWIRAADIGIIDFEIITEEGNSNRAESDADRGAQRRINKHTLRFLHQGQAEPVQLHYWQESTGTKKVVELAPIVFNLTSGDRPRSYFIDEIDASMHPDQLAGIIRYFNCDVREIDISGQLIFAAHETSLLDDQAKYAVLRRDQIFLTEKNQHGASHLYSVSDFKERQNLNLRRRYLQGRYGALPAIGDFGATRHGEGS